jgi:uncharacterized protein YdcH (DUF465 family)
MTWKVRHPELNPTPQPTQVPHPVTLLDRLEAQLKDKEAQFAKLYQELNELDVQIVGLRRVKSFYPQVENLIESLRNR